MSKLISGKEALIALANGEEVEYKTTDNAGSKWHQAKMLTVNTIMNFDDACILFRLKPRTITINGVELAPCYAVGIDHTKNEVSIQFNNNEDAVKLNNLLLNIYGFRSA